MHSTCTITPCARECGRGIVIGRLVSAWLSVCQFVTVLPSEIRFSQGSNMVENVPQAAGKPSINFRLL